MRKTSARIRTVYAEDKVIKIKLGSRSERSICSRKEPQSTGEPGEGKEGNGDHGEHKAEGLSFYL